MTILGGILVVLLFAAGVAELTLLVATGGVPALLVWSSAAVGVALVVTAAISNRLDRR